jgi:hypothetical protein
MTEQQCPDCKIIEKHDEVLDPYRVIEFCPTHAAAEEMRAALEELESNLGSEVLLKKGVVDIWYIKIALGVVRRALASARGEGGKDG